MNLIIVIKKERLFVKFFVYGRDSLEPSDDLCANLEDQDIRHKKMLTIDDKGL